MTSQDKPLGRKAYGSIPHLPGSRTGPGDYHCHEGQEAICFNGGKNAKGDRHRVIVTEKLDGSNVAVARIRDDIVALVRAGYTAISSPYEQHHIFAEWVKRQDWSNIPEGHRVCGEWLHQAHGTIYRPDTPFVAFDAFDDSNQRYLHDDARKLFASLGVVGAHILHDSEVGMHTSDAINALGDCGFHGAQEDVEGSVWRIETGGKFNFLAKYVRPEKVDGKYFENVTGKPTIFMCDPLAMGEG